MFSRSYEDEYRVLHPERVPLGEENRGETDKGRDKGDTPVTVLQSGKIISNVNVKARQELDGKQE